MNSNKLIILVLSVISLGSCSGAPHGAGGGGGGGTGTANLTLTLTSEAQASQASFTILAFSAQITSLTLNPSIGGNTVPVPLAPNPYLVDFNRLTTDSAFLASFSVPAQTTFGSMGMALTNVTITIAVPPTATAISTCLPGSVCEFAFPPQLANIIANDFPAKFSPQSNNNFYLSVHPQDIITSSITGLTVDFSKTSVVPALLLPRSNQAANTLDSVEDFTGKVTAVSTGSLSITSGSGVPLSAKLSNTSFDDDSPSKCVAGSIAGCVKVGSIVSMDAVVNTDGTLTATELDLLDPSPVDAIEGTIFTTSPGNFRLVLTDKQVATNNATLAAANIGDIFSLTLPGGNFSVDTKNLSTATPAVPVSRFQGTGDILNGQTVRLHVSSASGAFAGNNQAAIASSVQLRFTRFTASKVTAAAGLLTVGSLGAIFQAPNQPVVQTYPVTVLDKFSDITSLGGPGTSPLISIRALFLNSSNNFYATKIRDQ